MDGDVILRLNERRLEVIVAAAGAACVLTSQPRPVIIDYQHAEPTDLAFTPSGQQLIILNHNTLRTLDLLTGHVTTMTSSAQCARRNVSLSALSVNHDGTIYVIDANNTNVYTVTSQLPAPHHVTGNYDVIDPTTQQRYTFNRYVLVLVMLV